MTLAPPALTHLALTVSDLDRSVAWYTGVFGAEPAFRGRFLTGTPHEYSLAVWRTPNFALHHFDDVRGVEGAFDTRRPGLDHVAFECASVEELQEWCVHLDALGVARSEILTEPYGSGLAFTDPDGIALELFVTARRA